MMPLWGHDCPLPALAAPTCLSPVGDGLDHSQLALLCPLFCERAWQCFRFGLFTVQFSLSLSLAIPQSGLLCQVSSVRLPLGLSGLVLTLNIAACASLSSPHLLVMDTSVWAASPLGVAVKLVICGFCLFIFPPGFVAL